LELTEYELGQLLTYEQPTAYIVESTEYNDNYKTPVLTAGKSFVLGYTDETENIFDKLPVIIFDDFTTATQYVNFKFKVKSSAMKILHINKELVNPKYIYYRMQIIQFDHSTHKRYWIQQYSKLKVQIPPLVEQERIVAKIEELFSDLDNAVETLNATKAKLEVYRQAVLKEAFENIDGEEKFISEVCNDIKVGIVIKPSQYYTSEQDGIKAFRSANVREFRIENKNWVYLSKEGQKVNSRSILHTGDVLVVRSGYPGTSCVVTPEYDGCNAIDILIAVPKSELILSEYLCAYTNSPLGKQFVEEKKRGVGQKHFNVSGYSKMRIKIPTIEEQMLIVARIDEKLSMYTQINDTVGTALQQASAMRQSILKQAFEGRLL
jgi:putative phosphoribosylformylglycinamidine synthase (fragment)